MKILLFLLLTSFCWAGDKTYGDIKDVEFVRIYDADTIYVNLPGKHPILGDAIGIRLYGVDTPELRTRDKLEKLWGYKAKHFAEMLLANSTSIELRNIRRGKFFRVVAEIWLDGDVSLAAELIEAGYAYPYFGKTKKVWVFHPDRIEWKDKE